MVDTRNLPSPLSVPQILLLQIQLGRHRCPSCQSLLQIAGELLTTICIARLCRSGDTSVAMGIPYLTKHLLPCADSVLLGGSRPDDQKLDETPRVRSVVIDGPSLVYHVYYRLLAWMGPLHDVLDPQPTCNEVSRAVVTGLVELARQGIQM
jgi:hypothetical protein